MSIYRKKLFNGTKCAILPKCCRGSMGVNCAKNSVDKVACPFRQFLPDLEDELPTPPTELDLMPYVKLLTAMLQSAEKEIRAMFIPTTPDSTFNRIDRSEQRERDRDDAFAWVFREDHLDPFSFINICKFLGYSVPDTRRNARTRYYEKFNEREAHYKAHGKTVSTGMRAVPKKKVHSVQLAPLTA